MPRLALALVLASVSTASAGTYIGGAIGSQPATSSEVGQMEATSRTMRLLGGVSIANHFAVEGAIGKFDTGYMNSESQTTPIGDALQLGIAIRASFPIDKNFSVFGRVGFGHTALQNDDDPSFEAKGNGLLAGGGLEYNFGPAAVFADYQVQQAKLEGDRFNEDFTTRAFSLGLTFGF